MAFLKKDSIGGFNKVASEKVKAENYEGWKSQPEDKYEWVEGYKAVSYDMATRDDFVYQIGSNKWEGEPQICRQGLHFCPNLDNLSGYITIKGIADIRIFKCKGLVNISAKERESEHYTNTVAEASRYMFGAFHRNPWLDKAVCNELIIEEELSDKEVYKFATDHATINYTYEQFLKIRHRDREKFPEIDEFIYQMKIDDLSKYYSTSLSKYIIKCDKAYELAMALSEEEITQGKKVELIVNTMTKLYM